jgi:hypothetical protein
MVKPNDTTTEVRLNADLAKGKPCTDAISQSALVKSWMTSAPCMTFGSTINSGCHVPQPRSLPDRE